MTPAPTVGRIVHFFDPIQPPEANRGIGAGPYAAIVTHTYTEGEGPSVGAVDLTVFVPGGDMFGLDLIPHVSALSPEHSAQGVASWDWPAMSAATIPAPAPVINDGPPAPIESPDYEQPVDDRGEDIDPTLRA